MKHAYYLQFSGRDECENLYNQIKKMEESDLGNEEVRIIWFDDSQLYIDERYNRYRFKEHITTVNKAKELISGLVKTTH
jgi:hypothetical protein